jgi:hypothetical protein
MFFSDFYPTYLLFFLSKSSSNDLGTFFLLLSDMDMDMNKIGERDDDMNVNRFSMLSCRI